MTSGVGWGVGDGGGVKSGGKVGEGSEVGRAVGEAVAVAVGVALTVGDGATSEGVSDVSTGAGETSSGSKAQADSKAVTANREGKRQDLASLVAWGLNSATHQSHESPEKQGFPAINSLQNLGPNPLESSTTMVSTLNHVDTTHAMSIDTAASPEHLCRVCHRWPILSCPLRLHSRQPLAQAALGTS